MKAQPECDLCFQRQARDAAARIGLSAERTEHLLARVSRELERIPSDVTPPVRASRIHALVRDFSGDPDPYRDAKQDATRHALSLYPRLKRMLEEANDPLETAVRLAIAGNIIDLGVASEYDLEASIARVLAQPFAIDHLEHLRNALCDAREILYLADNAGETVLDRLLVEFLERPATYVVKGGPAVNDATREDAVAAGLGDVCEIIDNGAATLGTLLNRCSLEMRRRFAAADLIIAKGMANYESLSETRAGLFFLLQAKCAVIAGHLGVPERSIVVLEDRPGRYGCIPS
jgi:uncharacterized protein with ATP-grasp and redox domains